MKKNIGSIVLGLALIVVGITVFGNYLELWEFNLMFPGWWTLFIIIPSFIGFVRHGFDVGHLIGLSVGIFLLLAAQDIIAWHEIWMFIWPAAVILIGINLVVFNIFKKERSSKKAVNRAGLREYSAIFSGQSDKYNSKQEFNGANMIILFGGIDLDLRKAVIKEDAVINVTCIFGGADILVPENANLKVSGTNIFGGTDNLKGDGTGEGPTIHIETTCIFGGIDIR